MGRVLSLLLTVPVAAVVVSFVLSNREPAEIALWPLEGAATLPVWAVGLLMLLAGFLVGLAVSWLSHHRTRAARRRAERRLETLEAELASAETRAASAEKRLAEAARPAGPPAAATTTVAVAAR